MKSLDVCRVEVYNGTSWVNVSADLLGIESVRADGDVGTFTFDLLGETYDPTKGMLLKAGRQVRARVFISGVWSTFYTGKVSGVDVDYLPTRVKVTTSDAVAELANKQESRGVRTINELRWLLGSGIPFRINGQTTTLASGNVVANTEGASLWDQVKLTRDTALGYAWVDMDGRVNVYDHASLSSTPVLTLGPSTYRDIAIDFDTEAIINTVTIDYQRINLANGETVTVPYGPYSDAASVASWGAKAETFTMIGGAEDPVAIEAHAQAILARTAANTERPVSVDIPMLTSANLALVRDIDLSAFVAVVYPDGTTTKTMRVSEIRHTITPDRWMLSWTFAVPEAVVHASRPPTTDPGIAPVKAAVDTKARVFREAKASDSLQPVSKPTMTVQDASDVWFNESDDDRLHTFDTSAMQWVPTGLPTSGDLAIIAPTFSPTPTTLGVFAAVKVTWPTIPGMKYRLYVAKPTVDDTPPATAPDASTLASSDAQHQWVDKYPDGASLDAAHPSWFAVWAYNDAGAAPNPSGWVAGTPAELGSDFVDRLVTASLIARQIEGETISGITLSGVILDIVGALHAEPGLLNLFAQTIEVTGRTTLHDNLDVRGVNNILRGVLTAGAGVPDPKAAPDVWGSWPNTTTGLVSNQNITWMGLAQNPAGDRWLAVCWFYGGILRRYSTAGDWTGDTSLGNWAPVGITRMGSTYYLLGHVPTYGTPVWQIRRFADGTWAEVGSAIDLTIIPAARPAIGNDGTDILIGFSHSSSTNVVRVQHRNASTLAYIKQAECAHNLARHFDVGYVGGGMWDIGVERYMVAPVNRGVGDGKIMAFTTGGAKSISYEFPAAGNAGIYGMWWDGTRFWHLAGSGHIWQYGRNRTPAPAASYAYRRASDDVQTADSPQSATVIPPRAYVTIATPPPPDTGDPADPDTIAVYVADKAAGIITAPTDGRWQISLDTLPGSGAAPKSNGFSTGALGEWRSTALFSDGKPYTNLKGDGNDRIYGSMVRQNITLSNGYAAGAIAPQYRIDPVGRVDFTGIIDLGTAASGAIAFILPVGFRPTSNLLIPILGQPIGSTHVATRIDIRTSGEVRLFQGGAAVTGYDLSGVSFSTIP